MSQTEASGEKTKHQLAPRSKPNGEEDEAEPEPTQRRGRTKTAARLTAASDGRALQNKQINLIIIKMEHITEITKITTVAYRSAGVERYSDTGGSTQPKALFLLAGRE